VRRPESEYPGYTLPERGKARLTNLFQTRGDAGEAAGSGSRGTMPTSRLSSLEIPWAQVLARLAWSIAA
jgi:hypothetical protein